MPATDRPFPAGAERRSRRSDAVATAAKFIAEFGVVAVRKVSVDEEQQGLLLGKRDQQAHAHAAAAAKRRTSATADADAPEREEVRL